MNQQTRHSNPLKLREYLATGKPVVSVITPETATFGEVVYLADTREAYLAAIERALREDCPDLRRKRMAAVTGVIGTRDLGLFAGGGGNAGARRFPLN